MPASPSHNLHRLAVLLISNTGDKDGSGFITIGTSEPGSSSRAEIDNYYALLTASNISFEIINENDIDENTFTNAGLIKYVAAIVAMPFSDFSDEALRLISEASQKFGISLVSSYGHADERSKDIFGIKKIGKKRPLWPLKIRILNWPRPTCQESIIVDYGLLTGVPGIRSRGLKKLSWKQTGKKILRLFRSLFFPYVKVELKPEAAVIATDMKGKPLAWSNRFGRAINYYFAMHGGIFLDKFNEMHRLVRSLLETNSGFGMASISLENSMVLRVDDPGACCADYLDRGGVLVREDWENLGVIVKDKRIPISVVYAPGWVDDGDKESGRLFIDGSESFDRKAGSLYESSRVRYLPAGGHHGLYDHSSEYEGLQILAQQGLGEIHSHGLTHLNPDHQSWANASSRNRDARWYHEFYDLNNGKQIERGEQSYALSVSRDSILKNFGALPLAFTPSGHKHGPDTDLLCLQAGYLLFSADYTGFYQKNIMIRNWKIRSVFLYLKNPSLFAHRSGYPFIGVVHDYEISDGFDRFSDLIEKWQANGVNRFLSMNDLALSLCSTIDAHYDREGSSLSIDMNLPTRPIDNRLYSELSGREISLRIALPDKMVPLDADISVSGGTLISFNNEAKDSIVTILLKSGTRPAINICLPVIKKP